MQDYGPGPAQTAAGSSQPTGDKAMKKLLNDPAGTVREMLEGLASLHPGLALLDRENVIIQSGLPSPDARSVAILSGGGAGHEPAHGGYVGLGMLQGAVTGDVFTSPSTDAVLAAIRAVAGPRGAVLVVKNYTGDRLNFGLAAELARGEGIPVEVVVVADDVALRDTVAPGQRRGIAGTVLVHKVAGAAATAGLPLAAVAAEARRAAEALGTMGVALGACTVPAVGKPGFELADDEIELGLGIHGEAGVRRAPLRPADELVDDILATVITDRALAAGRRVVMLVNGLGGTPPMELAVIARRALATARQRGLDVVRCWCGNLLTALEMPGFSLTLMVVDDEQLQRLDAGTDAPAWPGSGRVPAQPTIVATLDVDSASRPDAPRASAANTAGTRSASANAGGRAVRAAVLAAADALARAESMLTDLDTAAGDGDLGLSMTRGAAAVRALPDAAWSTPRHTLIAVSEALRRAIAGSSGPFYATALLRAAHTLDDDVPDARAWSRAFDAAIAAIGELGGARAGDRTMIDALLPASRAFSAGLAAGASPAAAWQRAIEAAEAGAAATATMFPRLGRAAYLGARALDTPDGGAVAAATWIAAIRPVRD